MSPGAGGSAASHLTLQVRGNWSQSSASSLRWAQNVPGLCGGVALRGGSLS